MKNLAIPSRLEHEGKTYSLAIDTADQNEMIVLTYEHEPIKEDSFLIATYGLSLHEAANKMKKLLKRESIKYEFSN